MRIDFRKLISLRMHISKSGNKLNKVWFLSSVVKAKQRRERSEGIVHTSIIQRPLPSNSRQKAFGKMYKIRPIYRDSFSVKATSESPFVCPQENKAPKSNPFFSLLNLCHICSKLCVHVCTYKTRLLLIDFLYSAYFFFAFCWKPWPGNVKWSS